MKQILEIKMSLPSMNEIINLSKQHWSQYASPKKGYDAIIAAFARQQLKPIDKYPISVEFHWYAKDGRTDADNLSAGKKFILDGLVKAGILKGDNYKYFSEFRDLFFIDKENPRVEVILNM